MIASDAFVIVPGGISTVLEMWMIWQLLGAPVDDAPPLVGKMWKGLVEWAKTTMLDRQPRSPAGRSADSLFLDTATRPLPSSLAARKGEGERVSPRSTDVYGAVAIANHRVYFPGHHKTVSLRPWLASGLQFRETTSGRPANCPKDLNWWRYSVGR